MPILAFCFFCIACSEGPPAVTFIQLEKDIELNLWQELTVNGAQPQLLLKTIDAYNCEEGEIISEYSLSNQTIDLFLESIQIPDDCNNSSNVFFKRIHPIDLEVGSYDFFVHLSDIVSNEGSLNYSEDQIELSLNTTNGIKFNNSIMNRIPQNTVWGYVHDSVSSLSLQNDLLSLVDQDIQFEFLSGNYSHFQISENGITQVNELETQENGFVIKYKNESDWETLVSEASILDNNSSVKIYLQNFDGQSYRN